LGTSDKNNFGIKKGSRSSHFPREAETLMTIGIRQLRLTATPVGSVIDKRAHTPSYQCSLTDGEIPSPVTGTENDWCRGLKKHLKHNHL